MTHRDTEVVTLRRTNCQPFFLLLAVWGTVMFCALILILSEGFTTWKLPVWRAPLKDAIILSLLLGPWLAGGLVAVWFCLLMLHRVKISPEEIRICLGPIVLRRLSVLDVLTIVRTEKSTAPFDLQNDPNVPRSVYIFKPHRLVLSTLSAEQLREKARNYATRNAHTVPNSRVCSYMAKAFFRNRFWIKWTPDAEKALRKAFPAAEFVRNIM